MEYLELKTFFSADTLEEYLLTVASWMEKNNAKDLFPGSTRTDYECTSIESANTTPTYSHTETAQGGDHCVLFQGPPVAPKQHGRARLYRTGLSTQDINNTEPFGEYHFGDQESVQVPFELSRLPADSNDSKMLLYNHVDMEWSKLVQKRNFSASAIDTLVSNPHHLCGTHETTSPEEARMNRKQRMLYLATRRKKRIHQDE